MNALRTVSAFVVVTTLMACSTNEPGIGPDLVPEPGIYPIDGSMIQGRMTGDMPLVGAFDQDTSEGYGYASDGYLQAELNVDGDFGWAMVMVFAALDENGDVIEQPGTVIGCTGPDTRQADFDEPAEESDVQVEPLDDGSVRLVVSGTWRDGSQLTATTILPVEEGF